MMNLREIDAQLPQMGFGYDDKEYLFARTKYAETDPRVPLLTEFVQLLNEKLGISVYNCKIPLGKDLYNVVLYLHEKDYRCLLEQGYIQLFSNSEVIQDIFFNALAQYPLEELIEMKINPNGVFIYDFDGISQAAATYRARKSMDTTFVKSFPEVKQWTSGGSWVYFFFESEQAVQAFIDTHEMKTFKENLWNLIKQYDDEHHFPLENLGVMLSTTEIYKNGYQFFNSDAMNQGRRF